MTNGEEFEEATHQGTWCQGYRQCTALVNELAARLIREAMDAKLGCSMYYYNN